MWEKSKGPGNVYVGFFILALMAAYASMFSFLVEIFGTTTRVFPAIYLAIAATSWGLRGAIPATILNVALNFFLYTSTGRVFEGGILGPMGCLFATCLVGMISDLARQLEHQLQERRGMEAARLKNEEEKKRLEAQLYQAQKMESIGTLAGGIAHDFNNLLGGIMGHVSLGLLKLKPGDSLLENLEAVEKLAKSGGRLTKHLLGFARGGKYQVQTSDLNELLSRHHLVFGRTHKHITINEKFGEDLWAAEIDQGQIEQILFNIYINSAQAMSGKGAIFATTENVTLRDAREFPFAIHTGDYVKIAIRDTGSGMDEHTRERIFEPFFSTKEKGVGTGLGMAAAYGIVKNHGGYIHVISEVGGGTTIIILLPRSEKIVEADESPSAETLETGSGTILVVDDEEDILEVVSEMLHVMGYDVIKATGGRDGVALFREKKSEIDLVLLDMIMPDLDGRETFIKLKEISEDVKVLFQTGYSLNKIKGLDADEGCVGVIQKPFTIDALSERIKSALNSSRIIQLRERTAPEVDPVPQEMESTGGYKYFRN
jgi:signal transduction histidine kinase/CheY-like chemotaxis protein